jgi:small subunit ribosomal protein S10
MIFLQLNIKSFNKQLLNIYSNFLKNTLKNYGIKFSFISNPIKKKKITLLKSPHVHKKAREQFELRIHKQTFFIKKVISIQHFNKILINKPKLININIKHIGK